MSFETLSSVFYMSALYGTYQLSVETSSMCLSVLYQVSLKILSCVFYVSSLYQFSDEILSGVFYVSVCPVSGES